MQQKMPPRAKSAQMRLVEHEQGEALEALLRRLYDQEGMTQRQVAKRLGITAGVVSRWMERLGIPARPRSGVRA